MANISDEEKALVAALKKTLEQLLEERAAAYKEHSAAVKKLDSDFKTWRVDIDIAIEKRRGIIETLEGTVKRKRSPNKPKNIDGSASPAKGGKEGK